MTTKATSLDPVFIVQHAGGHDIWDLITPTGKTYIVNATRKRCEALAQELGIEATVMDGLEYYNRYAKQRALARASDVNIQTTYTRPKPFTWSYSRLKNYETCPKKHFEVDIAKRVKEEESETLAYGNMLHKAIADRLAKSVALAKPFEFMEAWAKRVEQGPGELLVEQKLAITQDMQPCGYFDRDVWFRGVADVLRVAGPVAMVLDWKTGKVVEDSVQLALTAQCIFSHYPQVRRVRCEFIWLKEDATSRADFSREDMTGLWTSLLPRVEHMVVAHNTTTYPAKPSGLCKRYCPVDSCPHHGVG